MAGKLIITVQPRMARIEVVDGWLQPKGSGYGKLELSIPPGLYEVRADSGLGQIASKYCSVREGQELPVALRVPFFSAAPLPDTVDYRDEQAKAAHKLSNEPMMGKTKPSRLMVFARMLHPGSGVLPSLANLELRDSKRRVDNGWNKAHPDDTEGWIGWCAGVDPGGYLLRWLPAEAPPHEDSAIDQSLWIPEGFTLMVFLGIAKNTSTGMPAREYLTLLQAPVATGFNPFDPQATTNLWAMEMALAGWQGRRKYLQEDSQELETLLDEKNENPLLGIVAAHSLWLPRTPNLALLRILHQHFQRRLRDHPDVVALEAHARSRGLWPTDPPAMGRLSWPPMLTASYRLIRESPAVIGPDTLAAAVSGRLVDSPVWMCWYAAPRKVPVREEPSTDPSVMLLREDQAEILGTWLPGAMQSIVGLRYLGKTLQDDVCAPQTGPRMARKVWQRFSETRDPVIQSLRRAILAQFQSAWERKSLGQFRVVSLATLAARLEIPEEVLAAKVQKALQPLANEWPPRRPEAFMKSPQVQNWLEELVMREATAQANLFDLSRVFLAVWDWLTSPSAQVMFEAKKFATENDFRAYLAGAVAKAAELDQANELKAGVAIAPDPATA